MLTQLKLGNFKIWKSTGPVRLAPVTLLLGTNSSGKSSLIQSLLAIRQTVNADDDNLDLNLGSFEAGDSVELGRFKDLLCRNGDTKRVTIEFQWTPDGSPQKTSIFSVEYSGAKNGDALLVSLRMGLLNESFWVHRYKGEIFRFSLGSSKKRVLQGKAYRPIRSFTFARAVLQELGAKSELVKDTGVRLLDELGKITYLGPVRKSPQRDYSWNGRFPSRLGDDGSKTAEALIASSVVLANCKRKKLSAPIEGELIGETAKWIKTMGLGTDLSVRRYGDSSRYEILIHQGKEVSNLRDVGVGVSQVLPVIIAALHARPGHIVILEEPESHLHPFAQSALADMLIQVSKVRNVQFIVETHSEHFLNRMQRRLAEQVCTPADVAGYFCQKDASGALIKPLQLDEYGEIRNWPENFFGDEMADISARTIAAMKQRINVAHE